MGAADYLPRTTRALHFRGVWFRVRVLDVEDCQAHGLASQAALAAVPDDDGPTVQGGIYAGLSPAQTKARRDLARRVVCAAVDGVAQGEPDEEPTTWDSVKYVMQARQEQPERDILHVSSLDQLQLGCIEVMAAVAMSAALAAGREVAPLSEASGGSDAEAPQAAR